MGCSVDTLHLPWMGAVAISTTAVFVPCTGWQSAAGISGGKGWGELRGKTGSFQAQPAIEHTNDVTAAGTTVAVGAVINANEVSDPNGVTTLALGSSKYIRAGWLVSLSTGSTFAGGHVAGVIELVRN